jgi:hypothetical protein
MHYEASVCPDADGDDCIGNDLPGLAPPNGIPLTTFTDGTASATVYAEILPSQVRTFNRARLTALLKASFQDSYTVNGSAGGPFSIAVTLSASGVARSVPTTIDNRLVAANVEVEIVTWNPADTAIQEQLRVTSFGGAATGLWTAPKTVSATPFSVPIAATATYTFNVSVGDAFSLAYGVNRGRVPGRAT